MVHQLQKQVLQSRLSSLGRHLPRRIASRHRPDTRADLLDDLRMTSSNTISKATTPRVIALTRLCRRISAHGWSSTLLVGLQLDAGNELGCASATNEVDMEGAVVTAAGAIHTFDASRHARSYRYSYL